MALAVKPPGSSVSSFSQAHALLQKGQFCFCFFLTSGFYRLVILFILFQGNILDYVLKLLKHTENLQGSWGKKAGLQPLPADPGSVWYTVLALQAPTLFSEFEFLC